MKRLGVSHWELAALATAAALGGWIAAGGIVWAALALLPSGLGVWVAARSRRWIALVCTLCGLAGAIGVAVAARRIRAVEADWAAVREGLVEDARRRLDATLGDAVDVARRAARAAAAIEIPSRPEGFARLRRALPAGGPELGVAVFDEQGHLAAWAGRHRIPVMMPRDELDVFITPFYVVLTARRQRGERQAVAQVLLAADPAVPDREGSVAARFEARTGVGLEFLTPRAAPGAWQDVFDYCLPACRPGPGVVPDTLFSVRVVPPAQGDRKLSLLAQGRRQATVAGTLVLLLLALGAGLVGRYAALAGLVGLYVLTPAGESVGLTSAFTAATYFVGGLGPFGASPGALGLTGSVLLMLAAGIWRLAPAPGSRRARLLGRILAAALVVVVPGILVRLARGITPPAGGVPVGLWLLWELGLTAAGAACLGLGAALLKGWAFRAPGWTSWAVWVWAGGMALVGLTTWIPIRGWPPWFPWLWVPALALAVQPSGWLRSAVNTAVAVGTAAALVTWGATLEGRVWLAERDLARIEAGAEPVTEGLLERFGSVLTERPVPSSAGALYREWRRSPLAGPEVYPAVLASWDAGGGLLARLDLAQLDLPAALLKALARSAVERGRPSVEAVARAAGLHYVLAVPYRDGRVVTVGVGPRSRSVPPVRVAQFLRGEPVLPAPYEISLSEPFAEPNAPSTGWRREGWVLRAERPLDAPGGPRHAHLRVNLGRPGQLVVRGMLVGGLDAAVVGLLWALGLALAKPVRLPAWRLRSWRPRSYRARLTLALSGFVLVPTGAFAVWSLARAQAEADRSAELLTRQTLRDAASPVREVGLGVGAGEALAELGARLRADLLLYRSGVLAASSTPVLQELGLVDAYLPPAVYRHLLIEEDVEVSDRVAIGGRVTQVGYRHVGVWAGEPLVLGSPRLLDDAELLARRTDLVYTLMLATLAGLGAAAWLAGLAARALARPVQVLRAAAEAVGQGRPLPARDPAVPLEFVPVVEGLERMARDVEASAAALEAARRRIAGVLRSVATGVVALDGRLRVTLANPRAEELLGVALPEGADVRELTGERWQSLWEWVAGFLAGVGREPEARELAVEERRIRAQVAALGGDGGCVVALDDTTELARAVRVLAWGELARQIAHEIKNPLTPLRLGIQHLERAYRDQREDYGAILQRTARQILAEIERLDAIARAFARFGAPPAEAGPLAREELGEPAREVAQLYSLGGGTAVDVEAEGAVFGRLRRDEFKEVLVNLIENARAAGARRVRIVIEPEVDGARVAVVDDGRGIPPEHVPRIFEPQFSTTTSGAGLGLAICKRLVESWGGSIAVSSEVGRGTTVAIAIRR